MAEEKVSELLAAEIRAETEKRLIRKMAEEGGGTWAAYMWMEIAQFFGRTPTPVTEDVSKATSLQNLQSAPTVKALDWVGDKAETPIGRYSVTRTPDGYAALFGYDEEIAHVGFNAADDPRGSAQDHAQADYEARIRSALVSPSIKREA